MGISVSDAFTVVNVPGNFIHTITVTDMDQYKLDSRDPTIYSIGNISTSILNITEDYPAVHIGTSVSTNGATGTRTEQWIYAVPGPIPEAIAFLFKYKAIDLGIYGNPAANPPATSPIPKDPDSPESGAIVEFRTGGLGGG